MAVMEALLKIRADVTGTAAVDKLGNALGAVGTRGTAAMNQIKTATAGALGVVRTFIPALGAVALVKFAKDSIDAADAMSKLSLRTGIAVPTLDKFRQVAELSDTSVETLGRAFPALASNIQKASQGTGPAADAFQKLGISLTDATGKLRSTDDVMLQVADRFEQMEDGTEKAALASDLFGRRLGSELIPMLNAGGDAVREMTTVMTQEFADDAAKFNDQLTTATEGLQKFGVQIVIALLPALRSLAGIIEQVGNAFAVLPEPVQNLTIAVIALAGAWALLAPIITSLIGLLKGLAALKIGATIAGWAGAIVPLLGALKGLGAVLVGVFTGPVGWVALAVAAGVAIYAFRDQVADALQVVGDVVKAAAQVFYNSFVDPLVKSGDIIVRALTQAFSKLRDILTAPFTAAINTIKGIFRGLLQFVANGINTATGNINRLISGYNSIPTLPDVPLIPAVQVPAFAEGGVVDRPTLAMVGEGGEREFIIPESKMAATSANYLAATAGTSAANTKPAPINITTGPVLQAENQQWVTVQDLMQAMRATEAATLNRLRTPAGRRAVGVR